MKILITGGTGFIGRHLVHTLRDTEHEITVLARTIDRSLFNAQVNCITADICNQADLQAALVLVEPDVVIHSAAMSKPNDCETRQALCYTINVTGTQHVVDACKAINARLIFMSTDFVFGHYGPYNEADAYSPVNYYGESKVLAEKIVINSGLNYAIVRTVMVYGKALPGQANTFLQWVKDNLQQAKAIKVFTDQYRSVTYINDLCTGIETIIHSGFAGIVHLCGDTVYTPFQLGGEVAAYFNYNKNLLLPVTKQSFPELAVRPENSVLNIAKAIEKLAYKTTPLPVAFAQIFGG